MRKPFGVGSVVEGGRPVAPGSQSYTLLLHPEPTPVDPVGPEIGPRQR
jgi:hypothetical protein